MPGIKNIAIVGSGNVARYLSKCFREQKLSCQLFARKELTGFEPLKKLFSTQPDFDLILLCVSDDAISSVSAEIPAFAGIIAHVSGATGLEEIDSKHSKRAVFYPLMSIRSDSDFALDSIPFCLEAENENDLVRLEDFLSSVQAKSYRVDSKQRTYLHLAAVLSQNFSNHLYHKAWEVMKSGNMKFEMLLPLLEHSLKRLSEMPPAEVQTGPAIRHDEKSIQKHLDLLENQIDKDIYTLLSQSIQATHDEKL